MPPTDHRLLPEARQVLDALLHDLDRRAPGMIAGVHLFGSIALGDARAGQSDIDLVLVRGDAFDNAATMAVLEPAVAALNARRAGPALDGIVLDGADLEHGPDAIVGDRPVLFEGAVRLEGGGSARNPVTWQTLRQCGVAYRGTLDRDRLWHDPARLDAWTRENLERYWRPWVARAGHLPTRAGVAALGAWATEWGVLGVTRLHATLATGQVVSKRGAGDYALTTFASRWHPIVTEAIRIRDRQPGGRYRTPLKRRSETCAYVTMVIDDALALPGWHACPGNPHGRAGSA